MSSNVSTSPRDKQSFHYIIRSGLAGGIAGCVAKTVVAPLDRVKILFQASNPDFQKYAGTWSGAFRASAELYRDGGVRGLFQGHSATLLRIFPYAAIKFMAYDQVHHVLMPTREQETNSRRFLAGAISGTVSVFFTYPLDVIRVRMAFQTKSSHHNASAPPTFTQAYKQIYNECTTVTKPLNSHPAVGTGHYFDRFPILKFYRGFSVTIAGMVPYAGVSFLSWGFLRSYFLPPSKVGHNPPTPLADLAIGAISGVVAQTASYPFEVIRRRMQVGGITRPDRWIRLGETISAIWKSRGWKGFYVGLSIGYLKIVPMTAASAGLLCSREHDKGPVNPSSATIYYMDSNSRSSGGGREKKTRRRLRLSCVECTKRRQKCDRVYPCSLCVTRGVAHLCRWETVPLARPAPARPPVPASVSQNQDTTMEGLIARIASLERALQEKQLAEMKVETPQDIFINSPLGSSSSSADRTSPDPEPLENELSSSEPCAEGDIEIRVPLCLIGETAYNTTSTLAQLCLGHHGEYVGRGSLICALHAISTGKKARFLYAKSTDATSAYRNPTHSFSSVNVTDKIGELIKGLPPISVTAALVQSFFTNNNWRFGIPQKWFHSACIQMWTALEYPGTHGVQINPSWLSLLFAVLACAPDASALSETPRKDRSIERSDDFFMCAMTARRIAEDDYLNKPSLSFMVSAADGTVLGCLAVPLLCSYLSERGRVSEAWKLVGNGIRNAEAVGMHRDPEWRKWQVMSTDEVLLRRRAWWGLVIWDKMYSFLLGRPQMIRKEVFDVSLPPPIDLDGSRNRFNLGQVIFIQLATLVGEAIEKCFGVEYPNCPAFFEIDQKLTQWEEHLPPEYQQYQEDNVTKDTDPVDWMMLSHQRYTLTTWYLICRMKIHIAAISGFNRPPQLWADIRESRKTCILVSMRLIRLQCDMHDAATQYKADHSGQESIFPGSNWYFEGCFSLFEATIAIITTLTRYPWKEKMVEAEELIDRAMFVFAQVIREEKGKRGEIARMAAEVLGTLRQEHWWRAQMTAASSPASDTRISPPSMFLPTVDDSKPMDNFHDWYLTAHPYIYEPSTQYNMSAIRDISADRLGFADRMSRPGTEGDSAKLVDVHTPDILYDASR